MRRALWPCREIVNSILCEEHREFKQSTRVYFQDVQSHTTELIEVLESYRELAGNFIDLYLSSVNMRMNEVMRMLTVIATIFIPLSFFTGIYGMNFEHIPELANRYAYPLFWGFCLSVAAGMLLHFKRKGWLK